MIIPKKINVCSYSKNKNEVEEQKTTSKCFTKHILINFQT